MINHLKRVILFTVLATLCISTSFAFANTQPENMVPVQGSNTSEIIKIDNVAKNETQKEHYRVPALSIDKCKTLDLTKPSHVTAKELSKASNYSGLKGLYDDFIKAEQKYKVNAVFLMSLSIVESSGGKHMYRENNMFGYGGKNYSSKSACIASVAKGLKTNYLSQSGRYYKGKTVKAVNKYYCTSGSWSTKVAVQMSKIYKDIHKQQA
ncbi:MAG: hypothetical protein RR495_00835 [Anaerovoracaceae bacterium]